MNAVKDDIKSTLAVVKDIAYIIGLIIALVLAYNSLDKRVTVLEINSVTKEQLYLKFDELKKDLKESIAKEIQNLKQ